MGSYIAHKRRKIKSGSVGPVSEPGADSDVRERELAAQRAIAALEAEQALERKRLRALSRHLQRKRVPIDTSSGRRHTAVRIAGVVLISATVGLRTLRISIERAPGASAEELWCVDTKFDVKKGETHYIHDPLTPAAVDGVHLMRAVASRVAEEVFLGAATKDADANNMKSAAMLAESYMRKTYAVAALSEEDRDRLKSSLLIQFEQAVAARLHHYHAAFTELVGAIIQNKIVSRSECDAILQDVYKGFDDFYEDKERLELFRPCRDAPSP